MSSILGAIEIQMLANLSRLRSDMDQAKAVVGNAGRAMQASADLVKGAFIGIASGMTLHAFAAWMKAAIDAGDAAKAMAQKTGLATAEVAGMQLAFKQGGVSGEALTTSMSKLSRQIVDGNKTFDDLGIKTRNVDGSLRSTKDVLYDAADAFAGMKDGAAKSAYAMDLFGKSGVEMIPTLNEGSNGLREMAEMAAKLGLVIDDDAAEAADRFNDTTELLGMGLQGVARQVMAQVLPALNAVAGGFLKAMTEGDTLRRVSDAIAAGMKLLYSTFAVGIEVFNTFGKTLGAIGAQLVALATGDFKAVMNIGKEWMSEIKTDWNGTIANIGSVWDGSAGKSVEAMAKIAKPQRDAVVLTKEQDAAAKAAADAGAKHAAEVAKLTEKLAGQIAQQQLELDSGEKLSSSQKQALDLMVQLRDGTLKLTDSEKVRLTQQLETIAAQERMIGTQKDEKKLQEEMAKDRADQVAALQKETQSLAEQVDKQREQNLELELGAAGYAALLAKRQLDRAEQLEQIAATSDQSDELRKQAALLRERASLGAEGIVLKEAKDAADEWKKTTDSIGQGLTDSLFRAFEAGRGFFSTLWEGIKNTFKTTILKLAMQPVQSAIGGVLGFGGAAANAAGAAGSAGGLGGLLSSGSALLGSLGTFGSAAGYGASALFGGTGLTALSGGASMVGAGSMAGGLGMMAGVLGPISLGLMAITSLFKDRKASLGYGSATAAADGGVSTGGARLFGFGDGREIGAQGQLDTVAKTVLASVASAAIGFGGSAAGLSLQAATDVDKTGKGSGILGFMRGGSLVSAVQTGGTNAVGAGATAASKLDDANKLSDWFASAGSAAIVAGLQQSDLAPRFKDYFGSVAAYSLTKEQADTMLATAGSVQALTAGLAPLGGVFSQLGGLSIAATAGLAELTGGFDAFIAKSQQYVKDFYSNDEQMAISAAQVRAALKAAGVDTATLNSKADFRALVDSSNLSTAGGQQQLAALLNVSGQFAQLADYLGTTQQTLADLADMAPQVALLDQAVAQADIAQQTADNLTLLSDSVVSIGDQISGAIAASQAAIEAGLAAVAANTATSARKLADIDDYNQGLG